MKKTVEDAVNTRLHELEIRTSSNTVERVRDKGQTVKLIKDTEEKLMKCMEDKIKELHKEMEKLKAQK